MPKLWKFGLQHFSDEAMFATCKMVTEFTGQDVDLIRFLEKEVEC